MRTYYTAIGHFGRKQNGEGWSCPIITINHKECWWQTCICASRSSLRGFSR